MTRDTERFEKLIQRDLIVVVLGHRVPSKDKVTLSGHCCRTLMLCQLEAFVLR